MAFKPFKKIRVAPNEEVTAKHINAVQENIGEAIDQVTNKDQLDSKILKNQILTAGAVNKVSHGLGRPLQGWYVIRTHGNYNMVYDTQDTNPSPNLLLYLWTPATVTVDLLVF